MKPLFTSQTATPTHSANPNSNNWDLLSSSFYHTLANSLPFRLLVVGSQELNSANYYLYYLSPIYSNLKQFSITNLLLAYTLPLLYIFSPTLIVPAIFVKSLQFLASKTASISSTISLHKTSSRAFFNVSSLTNNISSASSSPRSDNGGGSDLSVQDIEYWLQRCSICFDAQLDFCLDFCRDQFCRECFQRYVKEVVQNSWGLSITKIKCPVCQDVISQSEWSRYVDQSIIDLYNTYNKPYRSFSRCCGECGEEIFAASVVHAYGEEKARYFHEISYLLHQFLQTYISPTKQNQNSIHHEISQFVSRFKADYTAYLGGTSVNYGVLEMYDYIADKLGECLGSRLDGSGGQIQSKMTRRRSKIYGDMVKAAAEISARLVALEARPDPWRQLQFLHIANFPQSRCTRCTADLCLQCGEPSHHVGMSCTQYMRHRVSNSSLFFSSMSHTTPDNSPDVLENIKWKLANSKSCPNCSILINRDDGCNKVDCLHCGYRFCWVCRNGWSEKCGFYQCRMGEKGKKGKGKEKGRKVRRENREGVNEKNGVDDENYMEGLIRDEEDIGDDEDMGDDFGGDSRLDDRPEIGVPNVFVIQAKFMGTTSTS